MPGRVRKLAGSPGLRIPHMGWNRLCKRAAIDGDAAALLEGIDDGAHAYFVHSYAVVLDAQNDAAVVAETEHGQRFASVVASGRRYGAQFHPERSSAVGLRLLANFLRLPA
jgi:imidazole glycerol-phosphate synthase subunit HisH